MNNIVLSGRLSKDPERKTGKTGSSFCNFNLAVDGWNGKEKTSNFFDCICFGKQADYMADTYSKGHPVLVAGELVQERWEKDGQKHSRVKIIAQRIENMQKNQKQAEKGDLPF